MSWILWRLDARRRLGLWRLRVSGIPGRRGLTISALVGLVLLAVVVWVVSVSVFSLLPSGVAASDLGAIAVVGAAIAAQTQLLSALSVSLPRAVLADPDLELLSRLPVSPADVFTARLLLRGTTFLAAAVLAVLVPAALALVVVFGGDGAAVAWRTTLVVVAAYAAARALGRLGCLLHLRAVLRLAPRPRLLATAVPMLAQPVVSAAAISLVGAWAMADGATSPSQLLGAGVGRVARRLVGDDVVALAVAAGLVAVCVLSVAALRRAAEPLALVEARAALSEGVGLRLGRPFSARVSRALGDKDLRLLARRGPAAWEDLTMGLDFLPGIAGIGVAASALTSQAGDAGSVAAVVGVMSVLAGFLAVSSDNLSAIGNVDADGPVVEVLRTKEDAFLGFLSVRARRQVRITLVLATACLVVLAVGSRGALPLWGLLGLAGMAAAMAVGDAAALVVGSALFPAVHRPAIGVPPLEPQAQMLVLGAIGVALTVSWPFMLALRAVPLPPAGWDVALVALVVVAVFAAAPPAAAALTRAGYRRGREVLS